MDWPHAPVHRLSEVGTFMITAGTYQKAHHFRGDSHLSLLHESILNLSARYGWLLQAWAVFSNHYHLVTINPDSPQNLPRFINHLHTTSAAAINKLDGAPGRKVWFQYWDTALTYEKAYLARLNYVHNNPVKHGLVADAGEYKWCSASWFERTAEKSFYLRVSDMKIDRLSVGDDF